MGVYSIYNGADSISLLGESTASKLGLIVTVYWGVYSGYIESDSLNCTGGVYSK